MENDKTLKQQFNHIIHIDGRQKLNITGVTKVITFNEDIIMLITVMGGLNIKGKGMKINKLNVDTGDMLIEGEIISVIYTLKNNEHKENVLKKMFK